MRVLVTHPGLQHAHQLAWALEEAGYLAAFWSGVPLEDAAQPTRWPWSVLGARLHIVPIARSKRRHNIAFPLVRKAVEQYPSRRARNTWAHLLDRFYDIWVARRVSALGPDLVVCYENSALYTFRASRRCGAVCVLDAASIHYQAARTWGGGQDVVDPAFVERAKEQELDLADAILTCSPFAADTYRNNGVPERKLFPTPLGTSLPKAFPEVARDNRWCRFVFVGSLIHRKGVDTLLDAFEKFASDNVPAQLTIIGGAVERDLATRVKRLPNVFHKGFTSQDSLFADVATHHCLVLPSRFDSFGLVVPEAMAVGVPAIVSERVGAKCIIEDHPEAGWIVPCDAQALKAQMLALIRDRALLQKASEAARIAATTYSWERYRTRVVRTLETVFASHGSREQGRPGTPI